MGDRILVFLPVSDIGFKNSISAGAEFFAFLLNHPEYKMAFFASAPKPCCPPSFFDMRPNSNQCYESMRFSAAVISGPHSRSCVS